MAHHQRASAAGIAMAVVSTAAGALLPIVTRYAALHIDPLLFCAGSTVTAAGCVVPLLMAGDGLSALLDRRYRWRLMAISLAGTFGPSLVLVYGLRRVSAIAGVLLLQSEPIYSLAVAMCVVGEIPSLRQLLATGLILAGVGSMFWSGGGVEMSDAAIVVLLTPMMWQLSHAISLAVMPPLSPISVTAARYSYAAILLSAVLVAKNPRALMQLGEAGVAATLLVTGTLVYFVGSLTWYGAIKRLSLSWTTALVVPGIPLLSVVFALVFLGERAATRQLVAIGVAVAGIVALVLGSDPTRAGAVRIEAIEAPAPPGI